MECKYQLYVFLEDEDKEQILVSVNDLVRDFRINLVSITILRYSQSPVWDGLKRVLLREDASTREQFQRRVLPLLGNLPLVHEAYNTGKTLEKQTFDFRFELDSFIMPDGSRGYVLHRYGN